MESAWQQWLSCNSSSSPQTTGEGHTWPQNSFRSLKAIKHLLLASTRRSVMPEPQCQGIPKGKAYGLLSLVLESSFLLFKEIMECMLLSLPSACLFSKRNIDKWLNQIQYYSLLHTFHWLHLQNGGLHKEGGKSPRSPIRESSYSCVSPKSALKSTRGITHLCSTSHMVNHVVDITYPQDK